jgi:hypothetical protein
VSCVGAGFFCTSTIQIKFMGARFLVVAVLHYMLLHPAHAIQKHHLSCKNYPMHRTKHKRNTAAAHSLLRIYNETRA